MRGPLQWKVLHLVHATFMVGVSGLVRNDAGQVLLLRHRLWPPERQWGLPTGYARKSECFEDTVAREVHEETGLDVVAGHLVHLKSGYKLRVEVAYAARFVGGVLKLNPMEIIAADWFNLENLPDGLLPAHRSLIEANRDWYLHGSSTTPEAHDDPVTSRGAGR